MLVVLHAPFCPTEPHRHVREGDEDVVGQPRLPKYLVVSEVVHRATALHVRKRPQEHPRSKPAASDQSQRHSVERQIVERVRHREMRTRVRVQLEEPLVPQLPPQPRQVCRDVPPIPALVASCVVPHCCCWRHRRVHHPRQHAQHPLRRVGAAVERLERVCRVLPVGVVADHVATRVLEAGDIDR